MTDNKKVITWRPELWQFDLAHQFLCQIDCQNIYVCFGPNFRTILFHYSCDSLEITFEAVIWPPEAMKFQTRSLGTTKNRICDFNYRLKPHFSKDMKGSWKRWTVNCLKESKFVLISVFLWGFVIAYAVSEQSFLFSSLNDRKMYPNTAIRIFATLLLSRSGSGCVYDSLE